MIPHSFQDNRCSVCGCRRKWVVGQGYALWHYLPRRGKWSSARPECKAATK